MENSYPQQIEQQKKVKTMKIECTICLDELTPPSTLPIASAKCGHLFHKPCIADWVAHAGNCPQCRALCQATQLRDIYFNNIADRRNSEILNMTIVKDMHEFQNAILTEQDSLIEIKKKQEEEIERLRAQVVEKDREAAAMKLQLIIKEDRIKALEKDNGRLKSTNQNNKYMAPPPKFNIKTDKD